MGLSAVDDLKPFASYERLINKLILEIKQLKRQELESFVVCNVDRSARQAETKKPKIVPKNIMTRTTLHNLDPNFHQSCTSRNVKLTF